MERDRAGRERELRLMLEDPVGRIVLERKFFEATRSLPPERDDDLIDAILEVDEKVSALLQGTQRDS